MFSDGNIHTESFWEKTWNWIVSIQDIIYAVIAFIVMVILILAVVYTVRKIYRHWKRENSEWVKSQKYFSTDNIDDYIYSNERVTNHEKYLSLTFDQFHTYYSLHPERYDLEPGTVLVYDDEYLKDDSNKYKYKYRIIFKKKDYKKYRRWIRKSTNGMHDPECIGYTSEYLESVESDIREIRQKEAACLKEASSTMQQVMANLRGGNPNEGGRSQ